MCATLCILDTIYMCGILAATIGIPILGDSGVHEERQHASESPCPLRGRHVESGTGEGPRREVPRQRVLRSARHRAGQVRDAAPYLGREDFGCERDGGIRRVKADVLSDQSQLRRRGDRWTGAEKEGPPRSSQASGGSTGIHPKATCRGRAYSSARVGEADPTEIRSRCPSQDDRASGRPKKNFKITASAEGGSRRASSIVAQYETLRGAALGQALPPEA